MCAQFMLRAKLKALAEFYSAKLLPEYEEFALSERVLPSRHTPVIIEQDHERVIVPMRYSLVPSWSKEPKVKFATHNARIDGLTSKATWRAPLKSKRCLVPLTDFIEPIYSGEFAGKMVRFHQRSEELLSAAGLYDSWSGAEEELLSFAIITDEASPYIAKIGHDRQPIFLSKEGWSDWLSPAISEPELLLELLRKKRPNIELTVEIDRDMKPGWEKRIES